jgi:hypothetical protein
MMAASPEMVGASGASGIACEDVIAAKLKPSATAVAARSFMKFVLSPQSP